MDRSAWLDKMRRESEEQYDTRWAPLYGEKWGLYSNGTHQEYLQRLLDLLPRPGTMLDAACGAGRYLPLLLERGHTVIGIDQSGGMLAQAQTKFPAVQFEKVGLQEMAYRQVFDAAICMDAMEHVCPEDWPLVLGNFQRALKPGGYLYFTVEIADEQEVKQAFERARKAGLPVVYGEWPDESVYHYYPARQQVRDWLRGAGFELLRERDGDGYYHLISRKASTDKAVGV